MPTFNPDGHHIVESGGGGNSPYYQRKNANNTNGCTTWPPSAATSLAQTTTATSPFSGIAVAARTASRAARPITEPGVTQTQKRSSGQSGTLADTRPARTQHHRCRSSDHYGCLPGHALQCGTRPVSMGLHSSAAPNGPELANWAAISLLLTLIPAVTAYQACQPPNCLYGVDGDAVDWGYGELGAAAFTTEVDGNDFLVPIGYTQNTLWPANKGALIYEAKVSRQPYLLAHGPDAASVTTNPMTVTQGTPSQLVGTINFAWTGTSSRRTWEQPSTTSIHHPGQVVPLLR